MAETRSIHGPIYGQTFIRSATRGAAVAGRRNRENKSGARGKTTKLAAMIAALVIAPSVEPTSINTRSASRISAANGAVERGLGPKCRLVPVQTTRPCSRKPRFEAGQAKIADDQAQIVVHFFDVWFCNLTDDHAGSGKPSRGCSAGGRRQATTPRADPPPGGQVCLGIEIGGNDRVPKFGEHPGQMVGQRGLAYAALVVEESDGGHGLLPIVASTCEGSNMKLASGLPFRRSAS